MKLPTIKSTLDGMRLARYVDARLYAALRIVFGLVSIWCFASLLPHAREFFSNEGWLPPHVGILTENQRTWSIMYLFNTPTYTLVALWIAILCGVTMTVGLYSRASSWMVLAFAASLSVRNHFVFSGEDCILRNFVFLIALSRCGEAWSLDRWIRKLRGEAEAPGFTPVAPAWPLRLMQAQVCFVYFTSGLAKQRGTDWLSGVATVRALLNPSVSRWSYDFLVTHSWWLGTPLFRIGEQVTLYWELLFPLFLAQRHLRYASLTFGVFAHLAIFTLFQVHFFSFAMIGTYLCLAPRGWIAGWGERMVTRIETRWNGLFLVSSPTTVAEPARKSEPPIAA